MPYKRSSFWNSSSFGSSNSASTPGSSSLMASSPLAAAAAFACPDIAEDDEDGPRPPTIIIGDEQIDDAPFDPSLSDEMHWAMRQAAARAEAEANAVSGSPTSSFQERFARFVVSHKTGVGKTVPPPASTSGASLQSTGSRRSRFRIRRGSCVEEPTMPPLLEDDVSPPEDTQRELARMVLCTKRPDRLTLIPLDVAQAQEAIVRHPEGFELKEAQRAQMGR